VLGPPKFERSPDVPPQGAIEHRVVAISAAISHASPAAVAVAEPLVPARTAVLPEVQALRAVAVVLVLVFHVWPESVPGGYVGVDVFFVISGFLITSHLLRELDRTARISLTGFWARRARRLLPAAFLVLAVCAGATLALVPLTYWQQYLAEIRASTAYVQNWQLASEAVDYFAADNAPSPVQHYWSLSAEEQFYLVWPVLIALAAGVTRGRPGHIRRRSIAAVLSAVTALSLAYSMSRTAASPAAAYFVTPTRAWEFGAGGLLAMLPRAEGHIALRAALSWVGLAAIAVAAFAFTVQTPFPGCAALLPVLGALAVMRAGAPARIWAPTPALRAAPVQFVGDVSYSVYLWHWPLLVLAPFVTHGGVHTSTRITIVMLTFLAAWLTKLFVEDPVRAGRLLVTRPARWTFLCAGSGMALLLALAAGGTAHLRDEVQKAERQTRAVLADQPRCFGAASRDPEHPCSNAKLRLRVVPTPLEAKNGPNAPCEVAFHIQGKKVCSFGVPERHAAATIALIGDSHAGHWRYAVQEVARANNWHGLGIGHASCPLSKAIRPLQGSDRAHCIRWKRDVFRWLDDHPEVSTIFVSQLSGGTGVVPSNGRDAFGTAVAGYLAAWKALPPSVKHVIVIRDTPKVRGNTDTCIERAMARHRPAGPACAVPRGGALDRDPAAVAAGRDRSGRIQVADLTRFFCDRSRCFPVIGGALVFKDSTHVTSVYAATLGPYLGRRVGRLMRAW
jgi:peptidoglycan/LPS O-acetylase OafA/YrhL